MSSCGLRVARYGLRAAGCVLLMQLEDPQKILLFEFYPRSGLLIPGFITNPGIQKRE
jgi:hypothetical protein